MGSPPEYAKLESGEVLDESHIDLVIGQQKKKRCVARRLLRFAFTLALVWWLVRAARKFHGAGHHRVSSLSCSGLDFASATFHEEERFEGHPKGELIGCAIDPHKHKNDTNVATYDDDDLEHEYRHSVTANFTLPTTADALFFLSRGPFAHGSISFSSADTEGDNIEVDVTLEYNFKRMANVCAFKRGDNTLGVAVLTRPPKHKHHKHEKLAPPRLPWPPRHPHNPPRKVQHVKVTLTVRVPAGISLKSLNSFLPLFKHDLGDLEESVHFESLSLHSANAPISIKSVNAGKAAVMTSNSPVKGTFNVSGSLKLLTTNAPIEVSVNMFNPPDAGKPALLELITTNAHLTAGVSLTGSSNNFGHFAVNTITSNAPLAVKFLDVTAGSTLKYHGVTSNSPAAISLHPSFEGKFAIHSTHFKPTLKVDEVDDPSGEGRTRSVTSTESRNGVSGEVYWGDKGDATPKGSVTVLSSNAKSSLSL